MLHTRITAALALTTLGTLAALSPVQAHEGPPTLSVDPTSGPVGTEVTVSGDGCVDDEGPGVVVVTLRGQANNLGHSFFASDEAPAASPDGSWTIPVSIPDVMHDGFLDHDAPTEPGKYWLGAACVLGIPAAPEAGPQFGYLSVTFEVTPSPETPTTTEAPTQTPPPAAVPIEEPPPTTG